MIPNITGMSSELSISRFRLGNIGNTGMGKLLSLMITIM